MKTNKTREKYYNGDYSGVNFANLWVTFILSKNEILLDPIVNTKIDISYSKHSKSVNANKV